MPLDLCLLHLGSSLLQTSAPRTPTPDLPRSMFSALRTRKSTLDFQWGPTFLAFPTGPAPSPALTLSDPGSLSLLFPLPGAPTAPAPQLSGGVLVSLRVRRDPHHHPYPWALLPELYIYLHVFSFA